MNYRTMVKGALALSLSLIVGSSWADDVQSYGATFENAINTTVGELNDYAYQLGSGITNQLYRDEQAAKGWFAGSADDESKIIARTDAAGGQALQLNTDASTLTNKFASDVAGTVNTALATEGIAYFETDVKFVASDTDSAGIEGDTDATKFAIYAYNNEDAQRPNGVPATTNLVVFHGVMASNGRITYTNEVFDTLINTEVYTKLRIEMKMLEDPENPGEKYNVFSVKVGNDALLSSELALDALFEGKANGNWFLTVEDTKEENNKQVASLNFKGTGEIDNISVGVIEEAQSLSDVWSFSDFVPDPNTRNWKLATAKTADTLFYSNLVVNIDPIDDPAKRYAAAWVGTQLTLSDAATNNLANWRFDYDSQSGTRVIGAEFTGNLDGPNFMNWWVKIDAAAIETAIGNQTDIVRTIDVYEVGGTTTNTYTVSICPKNIEITNTDEIPDGATIKVVEWVKQYDVSWTVDNVTVTAGGAAAAQGYFAPNTVLTFTPAADMVITNIDGQAVANLPTFALTVTQSTNITVKAGTVQQPAADEYKAGDTVDGAEISAGMAAWLNSLKGDKTKAEFEASLDSDGLSLYEEYLLNTDPTVATTVDFTVSSIAVGSTVDLQVTLTRTEDNEAVTAAINGELQIVGATSLDGTFGNGEAVEATFEGATTATKSLTTANKFFKAVIVEKTAN